MAWLLGFMYAQEGLCVKVSNAARKILTRGHRENDEQRPPRPHHQRSWSVPASPEMARGVELTASGKYTAPARMTRQKQEK